MSLLCGSDEEQYVACHFSYSDRIRYYWPLLRAHEMVDRMLSELQHVALPETLISQYLPRLYEKVRSSALAADPRTLIIESVRDVHRVYEAVCR